MRVRRREPPRLIAAPLAAAVLLGAAALPGRALDLSSGLMKLSLFEDNGRFSVSAVKDQKTGAAVPLLAAQDPRTTSLSIVVGTKIYHMGENAEFSSALQKTPQGARFVWTSPLVSVTEDFSFVAASKGAQASAVRIDITLKNVSRQTVSAGARYLFDTYLGEMGPAHFITDRQQALSRETTLSGNGIPAWWLSPLTGDADRFGLQCMTSGAGITAPDRIVFANWKRLSDAPWSYETSSSRDFSLQPYSVNDSAVCQYYNPRSLAPGAFSVITIVLGVFNPAGFAASPSAGPSQAPAPDAAAFAASVQKSLDTAKAAPSANDSIRADLRTLDTILDRVDAGLSAGGGASNDELAVMESALADLSARLSQHGSPK